MPLKQSKDYHVILSGYVAVDSLFIVVPIAWGSFLCDLCFVLLYCTLCLFYCCNHFTEEEMAGCFSLIILAFSLEKNSILILYQSRSVVRLSMRLPDRLFMFLVQ